MRAQDGDGTGFHNMNVAWTSEAEQRLLKAGWIACGHCVVNDPPYLWRGTLFAPGKKERDASKEKA